MIGHLSRIFILILLILVDTIFIKVCMILFRTVIASINKREIFTAWLLTLTLALVLILCGSIAGMAWRLGGLVVKV